VERRRVPSAGCSIHQLAIAPAPRTHVLTLVDEAGETLRRRFSVLGKGGVRTE